VRGKIIPKWMVIQSAPSSKVVFLQELLKKKFPTYSFIHTKGSTELQIFFKQTWDGIILEMKMLNELSLGIYDKINKNFRNVPKILVLTPPGYQWFMARRKDALDHSLVILSDIKSLDYVLQLPRFIEEVGRKKRLRMQNERLQRLIEKKIPHLQGFSMPTQNALSINSREMIRGFLAEEMRGKRSHPCGLKLTLKGWNKVQKLIGSAAQNEVVDLLYRLISGIVRNSDRVLRSAEDEFLIFLSNTQSASLSRCKERLEKALDSLQIEANSRNLKFPVKIASLDHLNYLTT
jgi:GGDEF domain-containing protein